MSFVSYEFVLFFVAVILFRGFFRNINAEKWFLLGVSYVFVASWSIISVSLLFLTSSITYLIGLGFARAKDEPRRKLLLWVSVTGNLGILFFFKYSGFALDNVWWMLSSLGMHLGRWNYHVDLPVGISFFTFMAMTYTIDSYRRNLQPNHRLQDVLLFIGYFPQILAGPVNRAVEIIPQLRQRVRSTALEIESGLAQFGLGAVKKLVISDQIAPHVNLIFAAPSNYDGFTLLQGLLGYTIQIYCDFSGYSDMAIGCARMMGFRFMENFQMPYSAVNITEFWRRWHISLSSWFRDYLYIPLGGNRKGPARTYLNLILTMLLCGLWHGANWNFVFWGGLHGTALATHRLWNRLTLRPSLRNHPRIQSLTSFISRLLTLGVVVLGWLFFRAESWTDVLQYLARIIVWRSEGTRMVSPYILFAVTATVLSHLIFRKDSNWAQEIPQRGILVRVAHYTTLALLVACLGATDSSPFIYFQF
jgi:alginate O-acetyltransferase complex protein AlgI